MSFWGLISGFFFIFILMNYYIGRQGWNSFAKHVLFINKKAYWLAFWLLVFNFPLSRMVEDMMPQTMFNWLTYAGNYWVVATIYIFLSILVIDMVRIADKKMNYLPSLVKDSPKTPILLGLTVITLVAAILVYGTWNAGHPVVNEYHLTVHKKAVGNKQLNIVMISDIHLGKVIRTERLNSMADAVNQLKPDLIIFAGDIVEQPIEPEEGQNLVRIFSRMKAKHGKFAVPGNHDHFNDQINNITNYLRQAGITVLRDSTELIADSLYIIGRDDAGGHSRETRRKELAELLKGVNNSLPLILVDHQPIDIDNAQKSQVDLQLSGHTHNGQIFPFNLITGRIFEEDWGLLQRGSYNLIVSSGYGTWGPPMRIGNNPEIVSIKLRFE